MRTDTNMAWPDDPYGTGQLWRKEPWLLAGFAVGCLAQDQQVYPFSYAVAYLRLHRTQAIDLTSGVRFGFRTVTIDANAELERLLQLFDLDAMRARRLAKVVAGWHLADDLAVMQAHPGSDYGRGIQGLADSWASRNQHSPALAQMCEIADHLPAPAADLATAVASSGVDLSLVPGIGEPPAGGGEPLAAWATTRALVYALIAGRVLRRFTWRGAPNVGAALIANGGDCYTLDDLAKQAQPA